MKAQHYLVDVWNEEQGASEPQSLLYFPGRGMLYSKRDIDSGDIACQYIDRKEWNGQDSLPIENLLSGTEYLGEVEISDAAALEVLALGEKAQQAGENFTKTAKTLMDMIK